MNWEHEFLVRDGGVLGFVTKGYFGWSSIQTHRDKIPALLGIFERERDAREELERFSSAA